MAFNHIELKRIEQTAGELCRKRSPAHLREKLQLLDWAELHRGELRDDWNLCRAKEPPKSIAPLV